METRSGFTTDEDGEKKAKILLPECKSVKWRRFERHFNGTKCWAGGVNNQGRLAAAPNYWHNVFGPIVAAKK